MLIHLCQFESILNQNSRRARSGILLNSAAAGYENNAMDLMKMKKIFRLGFLAISTSLIFSPALHAENTLFGKINSDQKRWVGKTAPAFKLQDQKKIMPRCWA